MSDRPLGIDSRIIASGRPRRVVYQSASLPSKGGGGAFCRCARSQGFCFRENWRRLDAGVRARTYTSCKYLTLREKKSSIGAGFSRTPEVLMKRPARRAKAQDTGLCAIDAPVTNPVTDGELLREFGKRVTSPTRKREHRHEIGDFLGGSSRFCPKRGACASVRGNRPRPRGFLAGRPW